MGAEFGRVKAWIAGEVLTASDLNAEFDNILNNLTPAGIDGESENLIAMRATADPYAGDVEVPATSLRGEIQQIRYLLKQITGEEYWYIDPAWSILNFLGTENEFTALQKMTEAEIAEAEIDEAVFGGATFEAEYDNGDSGAEKTIDWANGNYQKITLTDGCTLTFTAPPGIGKLQLKVVQGESGSYTLSFSPEIQWADRTAPTLSTAVGYVDILIFYWDGTNYYGTMMPNFG